MKHRYCCWILSVFLLYIPIAFSQDNNFSPSKFIEKFKKDLYHIWFEGQRDLYVPFYAWHNRWVYSSEKIATYNEFPAGLGIGKSFWDEHGNLQGLYALAFLDSHKNVQPFAGYEYLFVWHTSENTGIGLGLTGALTYRADYNNILIPALLPVGSLNYKNLLIFAAYVPGHGEVGHVLFLSAKLTLSKAQ